MIDLPVIVLRYKKNVRSILEEEEITVKKCNLKTSRF